MTEQVKRQIGRRRNVAELKRKKIRLLLLFLLLFLGSGTFLYHQDRLSVIRELLHWLQQENTAGLSVAPLPSSNKRGDIYDRNFRPLAKTYKTYSIYARPLEMADPGMSANLLADLLGPGENKLLANLKSERGFVWVAKDVNQDTAEAIKRQNIKGVYQNVEFKRYYPNSKKGAHALGFVENGQGLDGIEFHYNSVLRGAETGSDELKTLNFDAASGVPGAETHLVLNLDLMLQTNIERFLQRRMQITGATSGAVILMDAHSGALLALASFPAFDPNNYWEFPRSALKNHALTESVYPGELARIFQQAAAFNLRNERLVGAAEVSVENDSISIIVPDSQKRRRFSVAPSVDFVEPSYLTEFIKSLGFNMELKTDLSLKDEAPIPVDLDISNPVFSSSALRLLNGFTALVNGGRILTPHLLNKAYQKESATPLQLAIPAQREIINPKTSEDLKEFLATKWLKLNRGSFNTDTPMFFETHNFSVADRNPGQQEPAGFAGEFAVQLPYLSQCVMLGAIPGKNPKLTMVAVLSYPERYEGVYPDALETLGRKFSFLSPDQDMVRKMLHVASLSTPVPTQDFWDKNNNLYAKNPGTRLPGDIEPISDGDNPNKYMPDITGKSLRAGLQALQYLNLKITLVGSGRIVSQHPPPGTELTNMTPCTLEMQQEI